jgi:hypothetical protein
MPRDGPCPGPSATLFRCRREARDSLPGTTRLIADTLCVHGTTSACPYCVSRLPRSRTPLSSRNSIPVSSSARRMASLVRALIGPRYPAMPPLPPPGRLGRRARRWRSDPTGPPVRASPGQEGGLLHWPGSAGRAGACSVARGGRASVKRSAAVVFARCAAAAWIRIG